MRWTAKFRGAIRDRAAWLAPLLLPLGVLAPTVCVLWFMNDAVRTQATAARQRVTEAYRGQLWLIRDRIDGYWSGRSAALQAISGGSAADFPRAVEGKDSVIFLDAGGALTTYIQTIRDIGYRFEPGTE